MFPVGAYSVAWQFEEGEIGQYEEKCAENGRVPRLATEHVRRTINTNFAWQLLSVGPKCGSPSVRQPTAPCRQMVLFALDVRSSESTFITDTFRIHAQRRTSINFNKVIDGLGEKKNHKRRNDAVD